MANETNGKLADQSKFFNAKLAIDQGLNRKFAIQIPINILTSKIDHKLKEIQPNFAISGFRKGKVPLEMIRQSQESSLLAEISQKLFSEVVSELISDNNYKPASAPKINIEKIDGVSDVEFSVEIELMPEIPNIDFSKMNLVQYEITPNEEEIQEAVNRILSSYKEWQIAEDSNHSIQKGDLVKIDYCGKVDGKEFQGGNFKDYEIEIGSKSFIDSFEEQLIGKKTGDEVLVKVTFPNPYHEKTLAGKKSDFEVKIKSISFPKKHDITDHFVKQNTGFDSIKDLQEYAKTKEVGHLDSSIYELTRKQVLEFLETEFDFDVPKSLLDSYYDSFWCEIENELKINPALFVNDSEKEAKKTELLNKSKRMAIALLIMSEVGSKNNISVLRSDWELEIKKLSKIFGENIELVSQIFEKNHKAKEERKAALQERKIIEFIANKCKTTKKQLSISQFKNLQRP